MRYSSDKSACVAPSSTAKGCTRVRARGALHHHRAQALRYAQEARQDLDPKAFITTADASNDSMPLLPISHILLACDSFHPLLALFCALSLSSVVSAQASSAPRSS